MTPDTSTRPTRSGVVVLNKSAGMTSRAAVDVVKRLMHPARTGHAGTLDPLATGVLVVCIGKATRLIDYVQRAAKQYRGTFLFGRSSPSEDIEGPVTLLPDAPRPSLEMINRAAERLTAEILQRPPAFSALKVGGRRSYDLARAGQVVEHQPRRITIYTIEVIEYAYPELVLDIHCGSGTYVRSLGRDLAESLGTAAVMSGLVRTAIGDFTLESAWRCEDLHADNVAQWLRPAREAVGELPQVTLDELQLGEIRHGRFIRLSPDASVRGETVAALTPTGELAAILVRRGVDQFGPRINLCGGD